MPQQADDINEMFERGMTTEQVRGMVSYETVPGPPRQPEKALLACLTTMCRVVWFTPANGTNSDKCPSCYAKGATPGG